MYTWMLQKPIKPIFVATCEKIYFVDLGKAANERIFALQTRNFRWKLYAIHHIKYMYKQNACRPTICRCDVSRMTYHIDFFLSFMRLRWDLFLCFLFTKILRYLIVFSWFNKDLFYLWGFTAKDPRLFANSTHVYAIFAKKKLLYSNFQKILFRKNVENLSSLNIQN